ncbi:MAG: hypothetical protein R2792_05545 [Saprospiraceae bacterium]
MENHWKLDDAQLVLQLESGTLPPELFSHEAHLRLAWINLNNQPCARAEESVCRQLKTYVAAIGAEDKYNEELTVAAVQVVDQLMRQSKATNFADFILEQPKLKTHFRELVGSLANPGRE